MGLNVKRGNQPPERVSLEPAKSLIIRYVSPIGPTTGPQQGLAV